MDFGMHVGESEGELIWEVQRKTKRKLADKKKQRDLALWIEEKGKSGGKYRGASAREDQDEWGQQACGRENKEPT